MKKEEMMLKATQMLAKGKFKLKKAGPTIMIVGAAIGGVTAAVLACKATLKAEEIIAEHNAQIETIHTTKAQVDSGEMQLKDGETYTADDMKKRYYCHLCPHRRMAGKGLCPCGDAGQPLAGLHVRQPSYHV